MFYSFYSGDYTFISAFISAFISTLTDYFFLV
jgi:hypothetical protein